MKKIRQALKAHILGTAWRIQLKFGIGGPPGIHTENFVCFCSGSVELQMRENGVFFTPVKYTLVYRAPWFLGPHDTLPCVLISAECTIGVTVVLE